MRQVPLPLAPDPLATFDSFLPGPNALAWSHLAAAAPLSAPVYLWGPTGTGKTHLLRALSQQHQRTGAAVGWFGADSALPWTFDAAWSLIVLDDVHLLDPLVQHAAFALLVEAQSHGMAWVTAGRLPPVDLPLREDLRTRLGWGHVFALEGLGEAETRAVLRREADRRGVFLGDEVMSYLLHHFSRDLAFLMRLLERLDGFALARSRALTVPLLKLMLSESESGSESDTEPVEASR